MKHVNDPNERRMLLQDELRPDLSAEAFTPRMRRGLMGLTVFELLLGAVLMTAMAFSPTGLLDASLSFGVFAVGVFVALGFFLLLIFGGLANNNRDLSPAARAAWLVSFLLAAPVSLPTYWLLHVRDAAVRPWTVAHIQ